MAISPVINHYPPPFAILNRLSPLLTTTTQPFSSIITNLITNYQPILTYTVPTYTNLYQPITSSTTFHQSHPPRRLKPPKRPAQPPKPKLQDFKAEQPKYSEEPGHGRPCWGRAMGHGTTGDEHWDIMGHHCWVEIGGPCDVSVILKRIFCWKKRDVQRGGFMTVSSTDICRCAPGCSRRSRNA